MPQDLAIVTGQQILFNNAGTYSPTALNNIELGTATDVAFNPVNLAAAAAHQSAKVDLGATRAPEYAVHAAFEFATAPNTGEAVNLYWAPSMSETAARGNPGFVVGADSAYAGGVAEIAEGVKQLIFIGSLICSADATATVQVGFVGVFSPPTRYGSLVVQNSTSDAFHSDMVESAVSFTPIIPQIQAVV